MLAGIARLVLAMCGRDDDDAVNDACSAGPLTSVKRDASRHAVPTARRAPRRTAVVGHFIVMPPSRRRTATVLHGRGNAHAIVVWIGGTRCDEHECLDWAGDPVMRSARRGVSPLRLAAIGDAGSPLWCIVAIAAR